MKGYREYLRNRPGAPERGLTVSQEHELTPRDEALRGAIRASIPQVRLQFTVLRDECSSDGTPECVFATEVLAAIEKYEGATGKIA